MEKPFAKARGFFIYFETGGEPFEQGIPHATSSSGTNWNGAAGPKGGGQEARNNVVHRQGETGITGRKLFCVTPVSRLELCERPHKRFCCRLTSEPHGWGEYKNVRNVFGPPTAGPAGTNPRRG